MSGFVGMSPEGFLLCPKCDHQFHGIPCNEVTDTDCTCPTSCTRAIAAQQQKRPSDAANVLGQAD